MSEVDVLISQLSGSNAWPLKNPCTSSAHHLSFRYAAINGSDIIAYEKSNYKTVRKLILQHFIIGENGNSPYIF